MNLRTIFHLVWRTTLALLATTAPAAADFNGWEINEIYSSADGSVQFIELFNPSDLDNLLASSPNGPATISSSVSNYIFEVDLPDPMTANLFFLVGTVGYTAAPGAITPDYTVGDNFFSLNGDTINYADVDDLRFAMGELPIDGLLSIDPGLTASPNSPTNFAGEIGQVLLPEPGEPLLHGTILGVLALIRSRRRLVRRAG